MTATSPVRRAGIGAPRKDWGGLGRLARASAKHRVPVLVVSALLMALLAAGIPRLEFQDNPLDAMPRGHPNTLASMNLTDSFPGSAYASPLFVSVDPAKWERANEKLPNRVPLGATPAATNPVTSQLPAGLPPDLVALLNQAAGAGSQGQAPELPAAIPGPLNITDEVYMRGMEELYLFLQDRVPELKWGITLSSQIKLVNFTNTGIPNVQPPDPAAFSMPNTSPEGSQQYSSAWTTYYVASPASVRSITSADWRSSRLALLFDPGGKSLAEVGDDVYAAFDDYRATVARCDDPATAASCPLTWNVFEADGLLVDPRGPPAAASYLTSITLRDLVLLTPVAILFVGGMLLLAFRRVGTVLAMTLPLSVAGFGVLGAFGLVGLPIHTVSLLVFPVLIGTGIDFGIHMASAYHEARRSGRSNLEAAYEAGQGAGVPLVVVTITTLVGMAFLLFGPNRLLQELGVAIILGLSLLLVVSLTALPAALSWTSSPPPRRTVVDRFLLRNAAFWGNRRALGVAVVLVLAGASLVAAPMLKTLVIGTPAAFYPPDDRQRQDFEASNARYFNQNTDLVSNAVVLEGNLATPAAQAFLADLESSVKELPFVRDDSAVSIHFALNAWIQVREGTAGAPLVIAQESAQPGSTFPDTEQGIRDLIDEMFAGPLATYATFFVRHPDYQIGTMLVEVQQPADFAELEPVWQQLNAKIAEVQARHPDAGLRAHVAGATAVAYLFTAEELPYLRVAGLLGVVATAIQVAILRRSLRDAFIVAGVVVVAGAWWLGILAVAGIALSIALVVPLVILEAIGSDYALHLRYSIAHEGPRAWGTVGRAVFYSAITDIGAFLVFTRMRYGLLADATIATVLVLVCALVATLILVPSLARRSEVPTATVNP